MDFQVRYGSKAADKTLDDINGYNAGLDLLSRNHSARENVAVTAVFHRDAAGDLENVGKRHFAAKETLIERQQVTAGINRRTVDIDP